MAKLHPYKNSLKEIPVSIVIPAYNEEGGVGPQIEIIRRVLLSSGITHEIIVVDDGSDDRTATIALKAGARVLQHPENRGYGAALKTGIIAAQYETIVIIDADGTYPAEEIPNLINKLEKADMAVGARIGEKVHIPFIRKPGKWLLGWMAARIAGFKIPDLNSGLRVFRRDCIKQYFYILPNGFSFTTTITLALLADNYHVIYHPINYYQRAGKSKIVPKHFMDFIILILRMAMLFQPLRIFVPMAFSCIFLGISKVIFDVIGLFHRAEVFEWSLLFKPLLSTSAILLILVGLQLLLIGMVSDALLRRINISESRLPSRPIENVGSMIDSLVQEKDINSNPNKE
jgi:glycosyltransferase involved in cell wall biosynthesis